MDYRNQPWYNICEFEGGYIMFTNNCSYDNENKQNIDVKYVKSLAKIKSRDNFTFLMNLYNENLPTTIKREVVSSLGRYSYCDEIFEFISKNIFICLEMDVVYQMFRTILYKSQDDKRFEELKAEVLEKMNNEVMQNMNEYYLYKVSGEIKNLIRKPMFTEKPILLEGDNVMTLKELPKEGIQLIFTSPPYYNAREYSSYKSYNEYLRAMKKTLKQCYRVLESGRYIIINVSPVISRRPGREFESMRYPIHFDFHRILVETGFYFIDEIIWKKPEPSAPYRIANFNKSKKPLMYKPTSITESLLVYRKWAPYLIEKNVSMYEKKEIIEDDDIFTSNVWEIKPTGRNDHPAVFPESLCRKVLDYYSFHKDIVLDPFAGSGTLGRVALEMGRTPVLCEVNKEFIEVIRKQVITKS